MLLEFVFDEFEKCAVVEFKDDELDEFEGADEFEE